MERVSRLGTPRRGRALLLLALAAAPAACGPRRLAASPASVCASKATIAQIRAAVFQRAASDQFVHDRSAMPKLALQSRLSVRYPLLDTYDRDTQKAACSAVLNVALPGGVLSAGGAPVLKSQVQYTSQPMADGSGVHFGMTGGDEVVSGIAEADTSRWAAANGEGPDLASASGRRLKIVTDPQAPPVRSHAPRAARAPPPPPPPLTRAGPHELRIVTATARRGPPSAPFVPAGPKPRLRIVAAAPPPPHRFQPLVRSAGEDAPDVSARTRVFVHIADPDQESQAEALQARLHRLAVNGGPVSTPPVRLVRATPPRAEVRCLKAIDCGAARRVAAYLGDILPGGPPTVVDLHARYQGDPAVRPGSLELWLPSAPDRGAPRDPPAEEDPGPP